MDDETIIALYWNRDDIAIRESAARLQEISRSTDTSPSMHRNAATAVSKLFLMNSSNASPLRPTFRMTSKPPNCQQRSATSFGR